MSQYPSRQVFEGNGNYGGGHLGNAAQRIQLSQMTSKSPSSAVAGSTNAGTGVSSNARHLIPELGPNIDMSALAGVTPEQVALIAQLFQSGALQLPPSIATTTSPTLIIPSNVSPSNSNAAPSSEPIRESREIANGENSFRRRLPLDPTSDASADEEDGEVISGKGSEEPRQTGLGQRAQAIPRPDVSFESRKSAAEEFVREVVRAGYSYEQLAGHLHDRTHLSRMFSRLGLPRSVDGVTPSVALVMAQTTANPAPHTNSTEAEQQSSTMPKRQVPTAAKIANRADYLARLQAAKNKKSEAPPPPPRPTAASLPKPTASTIATKVLPSHQSSAATKADKDRLLRERLAAVKAEHAAKQAARQQQLAASSSIKSQSSADSASSGPVRARIDPGRSAQMTTNAGFQVLPSAPIQPKASGLRVEPLKKKQASENASTKSPTSGLPGLFMSAIPAQNNAHDDQSSKIDLDIQSSVDLVLQGQRDPRPPILQMSSAALGKAPLNTRKRPVAADFDDDTATVKPTKRSFGQSRGTSEDESIIIEDSDNEDDDEEIQNKSGKPQFSTRSFRESGPLRDFPPRPDLRAQLPKTGTAGTATPNGADYERVVQDIEEMNRKIALLEKRKGAMRAISRSRDSASATPLSSRASTLLEATTNLRGESISVGPHPSVEIVPDLAKQSISSKSNAPPSSEDHGQIFATNADAPAESRVTNVNLSMKVSDSNLTNVPDANSYATTPQVPGAPPPQNSEDSFQLPNASKSYPPTTTYSVLEDELSDESISNFYSAKSPVIDAQITQIPDHTTSTVSLVQGDADDLSSITKSTSTRGSASPPQTSIAADVILSDVDALQRNQISYPEAITGAGPLMGDHPRQIEVTDRDETDGDHTNTHSSSASPSSMDMMSQTSSSDDEDEYEPEDTSDDDKQLVFNLDSPQPTAHERHDTGNTAAAILSTTQHSHESSTQQAASSSPDSVPPPRQVTFLPQTEHLGYVSPLTKFKNFRFHPLYLELVAGGYRSLTYNHKIDPNEPICQYEIAGGICNDKNCPGQHFASMVLTDTELLKKLCTDNIPVTNSDERSKWDAGLSALIKGLRASNQGNDVELAAAKIAQFRRDFLVDPSRVLNLT